GYPNPRCRRRPGLRRALREDPQEGRLPRPDADRWPQGRRGVAQERNPPRGDRPQDAGHLRARRGGDHPPPRFRRRRDPHDGLCDARFRRLRPARRRGRLPAQAGARGRAARRSAPCPGRQGAGAPSGGGAAPQHRVGHPGPAQKAHADLEAAGEADRALGEPAFPDRAGRVERQRHLALQDRARPEGPAARAVLARVEISRAASSRAMRRQRALRNSVAAPAFVALMTRTALIAALGATFAVGPAAAAEEQQSPWAVTVGAGAIAAPEYPGSASLRILPLPLIDVRYGNRFFLSPLGTGVNLIADRELRLGVSVMPELGRTADAARRLGRIGPAAEAKLFAETSTGPMGFVADVRHQLGGADGTLID